MQDNCRRANARIDTDITGWLQRRQARLVHAMPYICVVKNLSASGACIETDMELHAGSEVNIVIPVLRCVKPLSLFGEIVWSGQSPDGKPRYGLKLFNANKTESEPLRVGVDELFRRKQDNTGSRQFS